ncbi:F0F1 ATP synthase subunit delta [Alkalihalobacillus sp. MEB130]|uniref:F0F1 ATP synthase subunit delta n=1 Tax=Alkalihalobacillus sp. MEB130 TaxID=2976704 RepID=UPI0028DD4C4B|nr:F0F1 ATP synthase subunit delta [Alkalihalobacillus sp. MEB130]MDT8860431.1 F0F1 ATP synthase subunit delta [Alkalihalobacillus sp. MEB130]
MSNQAVANRYASALFQLAKEKHDLKKVNEELQTVKTVVETTPELVQFLSHPKVTVAQKQAFIQESFKGLSDISVHTLLLLIDKKRTDIIVPMINKYKELAYEAQDMAEALVYSTKPLSEKEQDHIAKAFAKKAGKSKLEVKNIVDSELIGGIKIRIGDRIYDGTIKAQLDKLERNLIAGTR